MGYVITITRQFGSLGKAVAQETAQLLGWNYYDRRKIETEAAQEDTSLAPMVQLQKNEIKEYQRMEYPLGIGSALKQERMFQVQSRLIEKHAAQENCVIVGRCAEYILKDHPGILRCYLFAPEENRIANTVSTLGITKNEYQPLIETIDRAWGQYYLKYTGYEIENTKLRDLLINTAMLGTKSTAEMIARIAKRKFHLE